jgi:hypothetical protein
MWTARERIEEAKSTGAQALVSACGWCEGSFLEAMTDGDRLRVYDIVQLVERAI